MTVKVTNFKLVDKIGQAYVPGEGHIDWYMDVDIPEAQGQKAITTFGTHQDTITTTFTWKNVPVGTRQFAVQLEGNDQDPLATPAIDSIVLNVIPPATGPAIYGSISSQTSASDTFYYDSASKKALVAVSTRNINITDVSNQTAPQNVAGQGHFIYYMDIDPPVVGTINTTTGSSAAGYTKSYLWQNVQPGFHTFSVMLVNNDGTPLSPPMIYKITAYLVAP